MPQKLYINDTNVQPFRKDLLSSVPVESGDGDFCLRACALV